MKLVLFLLVSQATSVHAVPASSVCVTLATDWRRMNENASARAMMNGDGNSELRKTRQLADITEMLAAQLTYQIMKDQGCPLPRRAVGPYTYLKAAMECEAAGGAKATGQAKACERDRWSEGE